MYKSFGPTAVQKDFVRSYSRNELGHLDEESNVSNFETYVEDDEVHTKECDSDETTS